MNPVMKEDIEHIMQAKLPWEKIDNTTILISGANSFLMSYFIFSLLERNRKLGLHTHVIGLCRSRERAWERFRQYNRDSNLELVLQDVTEPVKMEKRIDYCIHAASPAGIFSRHSYPKKTFETNVIGCRNLLEVCRKSQAKRFLFLSSVDVYGKMNTGSRLEETDSGALDTMCPRNAYSYGKRAAEALCAVTRAECGTDFVVVRPFQVYGPGMSLDDGRLHGDFVEQLRRSGKIVLKSDGTARRSFLYLTDFTIALLTALLCGESGEAYNICWEESEASVLELAERYKKAAGGKAAIEFDYDKRKSVEVKEALSCVLGDSGKLRSLGWKPEVSLEEGVMRTWKYYEKI